MEISRPFKSRSNWYNSCSIVLWKKRQIYTYYARRKHNALEFIIAKLFWVTGKMRIGFAIALKNKVLFSSQYKPYV